MVLNVREKKANVEQRGKPGPWSQGVHFRLPKFYPHQDKLTIQQILTKDLLCANSCPRWWGHDKKEDKTLIFTVKWERMIITGNKQQ